MRTTLPLLIGLALLAATELNAQSWVWASSGGSNGYDNGNDITTNSNGYSYVVGNFQGNASFDSQNISSAGDMDAFIAKYDSLGTCIWAEEGGGTFADMAYGVSQDAAGNAYVTGYINSTTATFGTETVNNTGFDDMILVKYDPNGNVVWAEAEGGGGNDNGRGISTDANGTSYVTGYYNGTATFGTQNVSSQGFGDVFTAKYDSNGNLDWIETGNGSENNQGAAVVHDSQGNVYVTGYFRGTITFDTTNLTSQGVEDIFIAKYDNNGNFQWATAAGGTARDEGLGVAVDDNDFVYLTGFFENSASFGIINKNSNGARDCFVAKLNPTLGSFLWVQQIGGTGNEEGRDIVRAINGNLYVAGKFEGSFTVANSDFISQGSADIFVAAYKTDNTLLWARSAGGNLSDEGYGVSSDSKSSAYATGYFASASVMFGFNTVNNVNNFNDPFIAKIEELLGAAFSTANTSICINDCIDFTDNSSGTPVTWEWTFEGGNPDTSVMQNPTNICYDTVGIFDVTLKVVDGSNNDETTIMSGYIEVDSCLSGFGPVFTPENAVAIYPNPSRGAFTLEVENKTNEQAYAEVYNMLGELVKTIPLANTRQDIRLEQPKGVYLIAINMGKHRFTEKLVIE